MIEMSRKKRPEKGGDTAGELLLYSSGPPPYSKGGGPLLHTLFYLLSAALFKPGTPRGESRSLPKQVYFISATNHWSIMAASALVAVAADVRVLRRPYPG